MTIDNFVYTQRLLDGWRVRIPVSCSSLIILFYEFVRISYTRKSNFDHCKIYAMRRLFTDRFCYGGLFLSSILELYLAEFTVNYLIQFQSHRSIKMVVAFLLP